MVEEIYDCEDRIDDYTSYLEEIRFTDHITSNSKEEKTDHEKSIKFWKKRKLYYSNLHDFLKKSEVVLKKMHKETENFPHWYK